MDAELTRSLNEGFMSKLASPELREKLAAETGAYVQLKVREQSFLDRLMEPVPVQITDLERNIYERTLHKVEEVEPDSFALVGAPIGFASRQPISAQFIGVPIVTFQTPLFTYTRYELDVFRTPILKILDENVVKDLGDKLDLMWKGLAESSLSWLTSIGKTHTLTVNTATTPFSKEVFLKGMDMLRDPQGRPYSGARCLMNSVTYNRFRSLTREHVSEALLDKFLLSEGALENLMGHQFIITSKTDIIPDGVIYFFAAKNAEVNQFGCHYSYRDTEFTVETYHNKNFEFMARMQRMMALLNGYGVAKLILT
jgi:hypothetical protein